MIANRRTSFSALPATNRLVAVERASVAKEETSTRPYFRGDAAAGFYLDLGDKQGRGFRKWAESVRLPFTEILGVRTYRRIDLDRMWVRHAENQANIS